MFEFSVEALDARWLDSWEGFKAIGSLIDEFRGFEGVESDDAGGARDPYKGIANSKLSGCAFDLPRHHPFGDLFAEGSRGGKRAEDSKVISHTDEPSKDALELPVDTLEEHTPFGGLMDSHPDRVDVENRKIAAIRTGRRR